MTYPRPIPTLAPRPAEFYRRRCGATLFFLMVILAVVAAVGSTVYLVTTTDLNITGNYKHEMEAFSQAEAGVHYVVTQISRDLKSGAMDLADPVIPVGYRPPPGFTFDPVTQLNRLANTNSYSFMVVGRSMGAKANIEAVIRRRRIMEFGIFGDLLLDLKPYANIYAYDSRITPDPSVDVSNGLAAAASNHEFITAMGTYLDGVLALGEDALNSVAYWKSTGDPVITGESGVEVGHIDPDPMGAMSSGGAVYEEISDARTVNENGLVVPPISSPKYEISLGNGDSLTLKTGTYYVNSIILNQGSELLIDNSAGPVNIYLEENASNRSGILEAKNGSSINILGKPTNFALYSNSSKAMVLKHNGTFKGLLYAPDAELQIMNSGDFYGVAWGRDTEMKNSGDVFIDVALLDERKSYAIALTSWKDLRH